MNKVTKKKKKKKKKKKSMKLITRNQSESERCISNSMNRSLIY